ncbi:DNA ligase [Shewanella sp. OPT22]|nr:DNA ligase [Shewanella sp. OPT22]
MFVTKGLVNKIFATAAVIVFYLYSFNVSANLQLATTFKPDIEVKDYLISEKLDGVRGRWDGSQMWTKQGNKINMPLWFYKDFPKYALDGELWIKREKFELVSGAVRRVTPDVHLWSQIKFMVFDVPEHKGTFEQRYLYAKENLSNLSSYLQVVEQFRVNTKPELMVELQKRVQAGAEGLMLHKADSLYRSGRNPDLIKLKQYQDAEAKVIAHIEGKGRFKGMLGSLLVELSNGKQFKIGSGFSLEERKTPPEVGSTITFKYFGYTSKKTPRFASFVRVRFPADTIQASDKNDKIY